MYLKYIWPEAKYICIWLYLQAPAPYFPSRLPMVSGERRMSAEAEALRSAATYVLNASLFLFSGTTHHTLTAPKYPTSIQRYPFATHPPKYPDGYPGNPGLPLTRAVSAWRMARPVEVGSVKCVWPGVLANKMLYKTTLLNAPLRPARRRIAPTSPSS